MPRVAVDILTPKQALLFKEVTRFLEENGADVHCTTRRYFEVEEMLRRLKLRAAVIGSHGGASLRGKLVAHADRLGKMSRFYSRLKPDLVVSFSSPEAARAAFGLSIPHLTVNDSPHAAAVAKLSVPLSSLLLTPWIIPRKEWTRYGIEERKIVEYRALDPASWLKKFKPSKSALDEIGLEIDRPILTVRPPEYLAAYMLGKGDEAVRDMANAAKRLLRSRPEFQVVVLSRYGRASKYRKMFGKKAFVTDKVVDGKSLLKYSTLFIGAGGTMTAEAALLGVPTISVFPGKTLVEEYLVKEGLVAKADKGLYGCILRQIEKPKDELRSLKK
ncbi:MAG: DUF354 domain-containing protein, partial [Candidatus Brockarchaeota archaeon]|nr:DUF354 domain-containing protein [Candidatus Brockarchaeota archaeon]